LLSRFDECAAKNIGDPQLGGRLRAGRRSGEETLGLRESKDSYYPLASRALDDDVAAPRGKKAMMMQVD